MGGIILGALGGAGEALVSAGAREQASQSAQELESLRASLEDQKEQRINAYKDQGATQAQGYLKTASSTQVPQEAAPVTSLSGADPTHTYVPDAGDKTGTVAPGFTGDPVAMRRTLNALPESADKTAALAQLERQISADTATNQGIVAGKMRDRSSSEVTDSAYDQAMRTGDVKAATAIKALQSDKFTKVGANEMVLDRNGRVVIANTAGADRQVAHDEIQYQRTELTEKGRNDRTKADNDARAELETKRMLLGMPKDQQTAMIQNMHYLTDPIDKGGLGKTSEEALQILGQAKEKPRVQSALSYLATGMVTVPEGVDPLQFAMETIDKAEGKRAAAKQTPTGPTPTNRPPITSFYNK